MGDYTVSVIVTTYNAARWIARVIESVLDQTYPAHKVELLVVDDGSSDQTVDIVRRMASTDSRLRLLAGAHQGTAGAVTTGLRNAAGEVICLLSHDCYATPDWIARVVRTFQSDPRIGVAQGPILPTRPIDTPFCHCTTLTRPSRSFEGAAIAYRSAAVDRAGRYFDPLLSRYGDDADMAWRIQEQGFTAAWLTEPTAYHEVVPLNDPFRQSVVAPVGLTVFPLLVGRHPGMRRRLRLGFLWGSRYRYIKVTGVHVAVALLVLGQVAYAGVALALVVGVAVYEGVTANRGRPIAMIHRLVTLPFWNMVSDLIGSYALLCGSIRWRSLVL